MPKPADARTLEVQKLFGQRLAELRKKAGMSQQELGAAIGAEGLRISRLERGTVNVTIGTLVALADALGVEPKALLSWSSTRTS